MRRRTAGWRNSFGGCVHCRGVVLRRRHCRTFHVDERMARCPRNRNSKILEGEVTQIPPSAPAKLPAKLPQQPPQDQDDLEHDRPSNLSARVGQLSAWLLEHPPSQLGRQLPTRALDFVRFLQRSRALRAAGHKASRIVRSLFWLPPNHSCLGSRRETLEPTGPPVVHPCSNVPVPSLLRMDLYARAERRDDKRGRTEAQSLPGLFGAGDGQRWTVLPRRL